MTMSNPTQITLYHYWRSSCSWRVRWALNHKAIPYQEVAVNLLQNEQNSPAYLAINPGGFVPAIVYSGQVYGESLAILEWLEEKFPANPLLPKSASDRMRVRQICQMIAGGIQPVQNLSVMRKHSTDQAEQAQWAKHWITTGLHKLESILTAHAGTFCFGGELTLADLCLVPQVYNANRFNVDMTPFPVISRINAKCLTLPACDTAAPHRQQGATP
jgi:maleylacetoacetate isomerase